MMKQTLADSILPRSNPVFEYDTRRVRWYQREKVSATFGMRWMVFLYVAITFGMLLLHPWDFGSGRGGPNVQVNGVFNVNVFSSLTTLLYVAADVFFVVSSIRSVNAEMNSGNWDLLKLTTLDRQHIIEAKYAAARLRAWPVMMLNRAVQTGLALYTLLRLIGFVATNNAAFSFNGLPLFWLSPALAFVFAWFIPEWRMRAMTAASVALSARARQTAFAVLAAFGVAGLFQLTLNIFSAFPRIILLEAMGLPPRRFSANPYFGFDTFALLSMMGVYAATFLLAALVTNFALRDALHSAFQPD